MGKVSITKDTEFHLRVYSNRWKNEDAYRIWKTDTGWEIKHLAINGPTKPSGEPTLFMNLSQDYISYPHNLGDFMEWLWEQIDTGEINTADEVQEKLNDIGRWISACETNIPKWKGWNV